MKGRALCVGVVFVLVLGAFGGSKVVDVTLQPEIPEKHAPLSFLFGEGLTLRQALQILATARNDPEVKAVLLRVSPLIVGGAKVEELRGAIEEFKASGKKVYAYIETANLPAYAVASASDKILMAPTGSLFLTGLRIEVTFLTGLLEKVGVKADLIQIGEAKGAVEPFTRTTLSSAHRKTLEGILGDTYDVLTESISKSRSLGEGKVKELIDRGVFSAQQALEEKLVDALVYSAALRDLLSAELKRSVEFDRTYTRAEPDFTRYLDNPFRIFTDIMRKLKRAEMEAELPVIALIYVVGPIIPSRPTGLGLENVTVSTEIVEALENASSSRSVKAVVVRVNSPGGSVVASDQIRDAIERASKKKPIIVSFSDLSASGGYYISTNATSIVASPTTITGSIGVVGGKFVLKVLYEKLGIKKEIIKRGSSATIFSDWTEFSDDERRALTELLRFYYDDFVQKVARGRKMTRARARRCADGKLWSGKSAKELGLVDEIGGLRRAIALAKQKARIPPEKRVRIRVMPRPSGLAGFLKELTSARLPQVYYRDLIVLGLIFRSGSAYLLPYSVQIK